MKPFEKRMAYWRKRIEDEMRHEKCDLPHHLLYWTWRMLQGNDSYLPENMSHAVPPCPKCGAEIEGAENHTEIGEV